MNLYTIHIRSCSAIIETVCVWKDLLNLTLIYDESEHVIEYKIYSSGVQLTKNTIGFPCDKLVVEFEYNKVRPFLELTKNFSDERREKIEIQKSKIRGNLKP